MGNMSVHKEGFEDNSWYLIKVVHLSSLSYVVICNQADRIEVVLLIINHISAEEIIIIFPHNEKHSSYGITISNSSELKLPWLWVNQS